MPYTPFAAFQFLQGVLAMEFSRVAGRQVLAAFDGGEMTSDAGLLLLREASQRLHLFSRMAGCFRDQRAPAKVRHALGDLLAQRVLGLALGYEDLNDHDHLRHDPVLALLRQADKNDIAAPLAGSVTLGRMEQSSEAGDRRYHKIVPSLKQLQTLLPELFVESHEVPPERIILDIDATDILTHGDQEGSFFNGYYEHRCFLPLYVFCGPHLLLAQLRPSDIDGAKGARNVIRRIVKQIRGHWPKVKILVRGDSGFVRENLVRWCEANQVDYIFGLARNDYLLAKASKARSRAAMAMVETNRTAKVFGHFAHMPRSKTWARPRHVITKVLHRPGHAQRCRFLVTSLDWNSDWVIPELKKARDENNGKADRPNRDGLPRIIYDKIYCPRGDMENRIKDCQLDLFGKRASAHSYRANQLRLLLAGFAYVLMTHIRLTALAGTELAKAAPNTIRLKLLKIGARVTRSLCRIKISMPDACPHQQIFFQAWKTLTAPLAPI